MSVVGEVARLQGCVVNDVTVTFGPFLKEIDRPRRAPQCCACSCGRVWETVSWPRVRRTAYMLVSRSFVRFNTSTARALLSRMTPIERSLEKLRETVSIVKPR